MTFLHPRFARLLLALALALALALGAATSAHAACTTTGACVTAGPRLASVDTGRSALLNPLLGSLLGTQLAVNAVDWNALAQGNVKALGFLNALQASANVSSPSQALSSNLTLAQVTAALGAAAQAEANVGLASALQALASQLGGAGATVRVGDLLKLTADASTLGANTINSLDMLMGLIQLYNHRNVLFTPTPVGISGGLLGQAGLVNNLSLYAQVIEPPVYTCGPTGSSFHSAAIRLKLKLDLVTLSPSVKLLTDLGLSAQVAIGKLDVYLEVARGGGTLSAVDAVSRAVTLQVAPGVASAYIGSIADGVFFNRTRTLSAADVDYGQIGTLVLAGVNVAIEARSAAIGQAPFATGVTMSGTFPQTRTVGTSAVFVANLADTLVGNLAIRTSGITAIVGVLLSDTVTAALKTIIVGAVSPVIRPVLSGVADPLLKLLGIGLGEIVVTVEGICQACDDFKLTKTVDKADASPGTTLTYTIAFQNSGSTTLNDLKIVDATPAYTTYAASACGALPAGLTGCTVAAKPAAGAAGTIEWRFTGTLAPGATGSVTVSVQVQ
ncbi:hypothetical protein [uncultured Massilia sp.]|uniref:hypothetical protein n=1 Tax=uncultured Massilia sp. TaxID=169973 RepID=UPI0025E87EF4|nr:hypothetical protein [uncultured Massilia sp.]